MNETKADMYGSYLAVFSFAIAMAVLPLFFYSKVGSVLWALVAWQIYRRDKSSLILTLRLLFWFIVLGAIVSTVWLLLGPPNVNLRQFVEAEGIGLAISAGVLWWMHSFFEKSPVAADIFTPVVAEEPASADIATVDTAPPLSAVPKYVAESPDLRAEPSVSPKTVPPVSQGTIALPTIIDDERIYAGIAGELETGSMDKGLWTRLFAECDGDEKRTRVLYIRQRAERLIAAERARRAK